MFKPPASARGLFLGDHAASGLSRKSFYALTPLTKTSGFGEKNQPKNRGGETEEGSVPGSLRGYDAVRHGRRGRGGVL